MAIFYIKRKTKQKAKEETINSVNWLYYNPFGKLALHSLISSKLLTTIAGKFMDTKLSTRLIKRFDTTKNPKKYKSFNEFFIEKKDIDNSNTKKDSIISPADSKVLAFKHVDEATNLFVKGYPFSLTTFLQDKSLGEEFKDASIAFFRLAPADYHRFHFPVSGKITPVRFIQDKYYSVLSTVYKTINVFLKNSREITRIGKNTLMCEVGATFVGSINQTYKGTVAKKGQEKGYFSFGGSSIILIFKKNTVKFDADLLKYSKHKVETQITVGEKIGKWK